MWKLLGGVEIEASVGGWEDRERDRVDGGWEDRVDRVGVNVGGSAVAPVVYIRMLALALALERACKLRSWMRSSSGS